jgi:hypothetical protein
LRKQWEGEGGSHPSLPALTPTLSRRERGFGDRFGYEGS